jgi:hypothetical protein
MSVYIWRIGLGFIHTVVSLAYNPNRHTQGLDGYTNGQIKGTHIALGDKSFKGGAIMTSINVRA